MDSTSVSLLRRLQDPEQESAWQRFVDLYAPLIFYWGKGQGLSPADAADLVQEVLTVLVSKLREFEYDSRHRFRGWLRVISVNKARDFHRRNAIRVSHENDWSLASVAAESNDLFEEAEYRSFLVRRAMNLIQSEFRDQSWQACWQIVAEGRKATDVALDLGTTVNNVRVAKCRVLRRLREELEGLMD